MGSCCSIKETQYKEISNLHDTLIYKRLKSHSITKKIDEIIVPLCDQHGRCSLYFHIIERDEGIKYFLYSNNKAREPCFEFKYYGCWFFDEISHKRIILSSKHVDIGITLGGKFHSYDLVVRFRSRNYNFGGEHYVFK